MRVCVPSLPLRTGRHERETCTGRAELSVHTSLVVAKRGPWAEIARNHLKLHTPQGISTRISLDLHWVCLLRRNTDTFPTRSTTRVCMRVNKPSQDSRTSSWCPGSFRQPGTWTSALPATPWRPTPFPPPYLSLFFPAIWNVDTHLRRRSFFSTMKARRRWRSQSIAGKRGERLAGLVLVRYVPRRGWAARCLGLQSNNRPVTNLL